MNQDLAALQELFAGALINLDQVDNALSNFRGGTDLNRERFAFYRGNTLAIWQQTCAGAYPVLLQLTGADFFSDLTRAYGLTHASQSGNLAEFGSAMAEFIQTLDNCRAYPYLGDLATLEWLVHRAYYQECKEPVTIAQLAAVPSEQLGEVCLALQPNCQLFASEWAVAEIWQAHQDTDIIFPQQVKNNNWCLIWQSGWTMQVSAISAGSFGALQAIRNGTTLGDALELALKTDPEFPIQTEMASWFQKQLITTLNVHRSDS